MQPALGPLLPQDPATNINLQLNLNATVNFNLSKCGVPEVDYERKAESPKK